MHYELMFTVRKRMFMHHELMFIVREQNFSRCKNTSFCWFCQIIPCNSSHFNAVYPRYLVVPATMCIFAASN